MFDDIVSIRIYFWRDRAETVPRTIPHELTVEGATVIAGPIA